MTRTDKKLSRKRKREPPPALPEEIGNDTTKPDLEKPGDALINTSKKRRKSNENALSTKDRRDTLQETGKTAWEATGAQDSAQRKKRKEKPGRLEEIKDIGVEEELNVKTEPIAADTRLKSQQIESARKVDRPKPKKKKQAQPSGSAEDKAIAMKEGNEIFDGNEVEDYVDAETAKESASDKKKNRFIVFVGNLPFTTSTPALTAHFAKIAPTAVRHITEKGSDRSKGFAFLEFDNYDRMKTCLKLYHHSWFPADAAAEKEGGEDRGGGGEDGGGAKGKKGKKKKKGGKEAPRKINVELTTGGGGNSELRKERLHEKNAKLTLQRKKVAEEQFAKRAEEMGKKPEKDDNGMDGRLVRGAAVKGTKRKWGNEDGTGSSKAPKPSADDTQGIHPSRLARMSR
ncbi:MAG: hypothetical protein M1821_005279 [Bathelium mastoideum]|nr:MAG: hypothetical protein M1821_005279 [Bathelium mastoideum]KAI9689152.1 MAG: hypothetical protein M1822_000890 [Bathelium mastoideum]